MPAAKKKYRVIVEYVRYPVDRIAYEGDVIDDIPPMFVDELIEAGWIEETTDKVTGSTQDPAVAAEEEADQADTADDTNEETD